MVNSPSQKAVPSGEYSSFARARSTPSARIVPWSNARRRAGGRARASRTGIHTASAASVPATGDAGRGTSARWATVTTRARGSRRGAP
jgi:hypothetical protein